MVLDIDIDGNEHPQALVGGRTENATVVTNLLVGLRERGLDVTRPMLIASTDPRHCAKRSSTYWISGYPA